MYKNKYELKTLISHCHDSINLADKDISKITNDILNIPGMSGRKTRHLYNNICSLKDANYLEVGTWKGSSFISAIYNNNLTPIVIDNWSEFNGPKKEFFNNVQKFCPNNKFNWIEKDCFTISPDEIFKIYKSIDIYMYDGNHSFESQRNAITYFKKFLSTYSIIIIDDFSYDIVSTGTYQGFKDANLIIHDQIIKNSYEHIDGKDTYWNGVGIFVCERKD